MGNVSMEARDINYRGGETKMSVEDALKSTSGEAAAIAALQGNVSDLNSNKANKADIATEFSDLTNYNSGDLVYYEGALYEFQVDHTAGAWETSEVIQKDLSDIATTLKSGLTGLNNIVKTVNNQPDTATDDNIKRDILSIMSDAHAPYCVNVRYAGEDAMLVGARMGNNYVSAIVIGIGSISYYKYFGGAWTVTPIA